MQWDELFDCLEFDYECPIDNQIDAPLSYWLTTVAQLDRHLPRDVNAPVPKFNSERRLVNVLEKARPEGTMHLNSRPYHAASKLITNLFLKSSAPLRLCV